MVTRATPWAFSLAVAVLGAVVGLAPPRASHAQEAAAPPRQLVLRGQEAVAVALPILIQKRQYAEALQILRTLPAETRADPGMMLVEAQLLRRTGAGRSAVSLYRTLLSRTPSDQRVRLELGETLFELKDLRSSEYYFRLALSGALPDSDRRMARAFLSQILASRPWSIAGGLGVAPDSNVNGATSASQVELWGLPFRLSDEARRRSGVAVTGYVTGEGSLRLGPGARLTGSAWGQAVETRERAFSNEGLGLRLGPEFVRGSLRWSLAATGERRWYGGKTLYDAAGAQAAADLGVSGGRTVYSGSLGAQRMDYEALQARDGWLYVADATRTRYLSPTMLWRASATLRVNRAAAPWESYDQGRLAVGAYRTLPFRLGIYAEPSVSVGRYKGRDPLFGRVREDRETALSLRLIKEDYSFWGLAPYLGVQVSRTSSNITLYDFSRRRAEFGLTRTF